MLTASFLLRLLSSADNTFFSSSAEGGSHDLTIERRFAIATLALLKNMSTAFVDSDINY